jgi:hypothetical protein
MATHKTYSRWILRDVRRIGALFVGAAVVFGILVYVSDASPIQRWVKAFSPSPAVKKAQTDPASEQRLYTGSILFVPTRGNLCEEWLLDNRNGQMWENGKVTCPGVNASNTQTTQTEGTSVSRMKAIGKFFKE